MDKKLPSIFKNTNYGPINNNKKIFYSTLDTQKENSIKENWDIDGEYIFNTPVNIETNDGTIQTKIVSKVKDHILTSNNKKIKLKDIKSIKVVY